MTHKELSGYGRYLVEKRGFIDPTHTKQRVQEIVAEGYSLNKIARATGVPPSTLSRLHRGEAKVVKPQYAKVIAQLTVERARDVLAPPRPYVDDVQLARLLAGSDVVLASYDKPAYARALYAHGWQRTRISKKLAMSGTYVNRALGITT